MSRAEGNTSILALLPHPANPGLRSQPHFAFLGSSEKRREIENIGRVRTDGTATQCPGTKRPKPASDTTSDSGTRKHRDEHSESQPRQHQQ